MLTELSESNKTIFNQVWEGLVSQDFEITCYGRYRDLDGIARSPIGWLMTDAEYKEFGSTDYGGKWLSIGRLCNAELKERFYDVRLIIYDLENLYHQKKLADKIYGNHSEEVKLKYASRYDIQQYGLLRGYFEPYPDTFNPVISGN